MNLGVPSANFDWQMIVVYRGKHCPLCTNYLGELNALLPKFHEEGVKVIAVSADPEAKAQDQLGPAPDYPFGYGLTLDQMRQLGLYILHPRNAEETDAPLAEPGLFAINGDGELQIADVSNAPFARPALQSMLAGLSFVKNRADNYPIRGTHD